MQAKDVMRSRVVTVRPDMTLRQAAKVMDDRHISGTPVVDAKGALVGLVSQTDLIRHNRVAGPGPSSARRLSSPSRAAGRSGGGQYEELDYTCVEEIMTPWTVSFEENTPVKEIARQMGRKNIHRVVITKNGKMTGIVSSMDLVRLLAQMLSGK